MNDVHMNICFLIEVLFSVVSIVQDSTVICDYPISTDPLAEMGVTTYRGLVETVLYLCSKLGNIHFSNLATSRN